MTTVAQVITAWEDVFDSVAVQAITPKYYSYEIIESSETDLAKYKHNQVINFFIYNVSKKTEKRLMGAERQSFQVEVKYYKEHLRSAAGTNQQAIKSALETVYSGVKAELGDTWNDTVDYYEFQDAFYPLEQINLAGRDAWLGKMVFIGTKTQI